MSAWARWVEIYRHYATVHIVEWTDKSPADIYRHYRQLDGDKYRPHGDGLIVTDGTATTYVTFHATEPELGVDLPTPPAVVMDGQDPLIGDET